MHSAARRATPIAPTCPPNWLCKAIERSHRLYVHVFGRLPSDAGHIVRTRVLFQANINGCTARARCASPRPLVLADLPVDVVVVLEQQERAGRGGPSASGAAARAVGGQISASTSPSGSTGRAATRMPLPRQPSCSIACQSPRPTGRSGTRSSRPTCHERRLALYAQAISVARRKRRDRPSVARRAARNDDGPP